MPYSFITFLCAKAVFFIEIKRFVGEVCFLIWFPKNPGSPVYSLM
jgi:hypothetical protein